MEKKKKIAILCAAAAVIVIVAVVLCIVLLNRPSSPQEETGLTTSGVSDGEMLQNPEETEQQEEETPLEPTSQDTGEAITGTGREESYSIPMSRLYTFTDPADIRFDTRYVLYGDSSCNMARGLSNQGYSVEGVYEILYTYQGKCTGEYQCYVMDSEADAIGAYNYLSQYYYGENSHCERHGDVVFIVNDGDYVQETYIEFYYNQNAISAPTAEAYLGMGFFFRGMSTYHGSASVPVSSSGTTGTQSAGLGGTVSGGAVNPTLPLEPVGTIDEPFSLKISDSYTFTDPEGLDFDARYVLYGGSNSSAVTIVNQQGCHVAEMYEILYVKDGRAVAEYRCYRGADEASAQQMAQLYNASCYQDVVVLYSDQAVLEQMMGYYVQFGGMSEATPTAYLQYMMANEGMVPYQGTTVPESPAPQPPVDPAPGGDTEEPNPGGEEETPNPGGEDKPPVPTEGIQLGDSYVFTDPEGMDYDARYVLYGDSSNPFAVQNGAEEFYVILYAKESAPLGEYQCYVMADDAGAAALAEKLSGFYDISLSKDNVVVVFNSGEYVQQTIDLYVQLGMMSEATVEAYYSAMYMPYGMTLTEDTVYPEAPQEPEGIHLGDSYVFTDPEGLDYDARYVLYGDSSNPFAVQNGAEEFYVILYAKETAPLGEYQCYVMGDNASAAALAEKLSGFYDISLSKDNVVVVFNSGEYVQQTMDLYVQYGMMSEATVEAYYNAMYVPYGMTLTEDTIPVPETVEISTAAVTPYFKEDESGEN